MRVVEGYQNDEISSHKRVALTDPIGEQRFLYLLEDKSDFELDTDEGTCSTCQYEVDLIDVELWGDVIKDTSTNDADKNRYIRHSAWLWTILCPCCEKEAKGAEVWRGSIETKFDKEDVYQKYLDDLMTIDSMEASLEVILCD